MTKLILHAKKLWKPVDNGLYTGFEPVEDIEIQECKPEFQWKGAKIPFTLWGQIASFLRWTQKEFKAEALVTLFYNTDTNEWAAWAFPQEPNGMTIRTLPEHELTKPDRAQFGRGWVQFGSVHHHCTAGAFASGTDKSDEEDRDGFHVTLGKMEEHVMDIHVRQTFGGIVSDTKIEHWVETPDFLNGLPNYMRLDAIGYAFKAVQGIPHNPEWESRIIEKKATVITHPNSQDSTNQSITNLRAAAGSASGMPKDDKGIPLYIHMAQTSGEYELRVETILDSIMKRLDIDLEMMDVVLNQAYTALMPKPDEKVQAVRRKVLAALQMCGTTAPYCGRVIQNMLERKINKESHTESARKLQQEVDAWNQEQAELARAYGVD